MNRGLDTGFLVALEVAEHVLHQAAREKLESLLALGDRLSLAATYRTAGVRSLLTTNPRDFTVLGEFDCVTP